MGSRLTQLLFLTADLWRLARIPPRRQSTRLVHRSTRRRVPAQHRRPIRERRAASRRTFGDRTTQHIVSCDVLFRNTKVYLDLAIRRAQCTFNSLLHEFIETGQQWNIVEEQVGRDSAGTQHFKQVPRQPEARYVGQTLNVKFFDEVRSKRLLSSIVSPTVSCAPSMVCPPTKVAPICRNSCNPPARISCRQRLHVRPTGQ